MYISWSFVLTSTRVATVGLLANYHYHGDITNIRTWRIRFYSFLLFIRNNLTYAFRNFFRLLYFVFPVSGWMGFPVSAGKGGGGSVQ